jgi:hypothetical protein
MEPPKDRSMKIIDSFLTYEQVSFKTFKMAYKTGNMNICLLITERYMADNTKYIKKCDKYLNQHKTQSLNESKYDDYGNNIHNIEFIKWLFSPSSTERFKKSWQFKESSYDIPLYQLYVYPNIPSIRRFKQKQNIIKYCMKAGILDLVKLCYANFGIDDKYYFQHIRILFRHGYIDIVKWMYDLDQIYWKQSFKNLFPVINQLLVCKFNGYHVLEREFEKYKQIIQYLANVCDDIILKNVIIDNIDCTQHQICTIERISDEDKLLQNSLRFVWLNSCLVK